MLRYIFRRLLMLIPVVLGVALFIFAVMDFTPGDPAVMILGEGATEAEYAATIWVHPRICSSHRLAET